MTGIYYFCFIESFRLINDEVIFGDVKGKEKAKQQYEAAKAAGQSAGQVAQK